jgi:hypothetical protein
MKNRMQELRTEYQWPYLVMLFESHDLASPSYALVTPGANFNVATVRAHKLVLQSQANYHNNTMVKVPKPRKLCHQVNHNCPRLHTQLIRFDKVCCVCVASSPNGRLVNCMRIVQDTTDYWVYDFKDAYSHIFQEYQQNRIRVFGNYRKR